MAPAQRNPKRATTLGRGFYVRPDGTRGTRADGLC